MDIDPVLLAIARMAEHGLTLTATVTVKGTVVSGRIIGKRQYLYGIRRLFNSQVHEENLPGLSDILTLFESLSDETEDPFLHFERASIRDGTPTRDRPLGYWRVKLTQIDGFSFGC